MGTSCCPKLLNRDQVNGVHSPTVPMEPYQAPHKAVTPVVDAVYQIMKGNPGWNLKQVKDEVFSQISKGILNMDIAGTKIDHTS